MEEQIRERPLTDLVGEIMGDVQRLVRDEVKLARAEITRSIQQVAVGAAAIAIAAALGYLGVLFIGFAVFWAIFLAIPGWAAALAVAVGFFILAGIALFVGYQRLKPSRLAPRETLETLEEDREWLERRVR